MNMLLACGPTGETVLLLFVLFIVLPLAVIMGLLHLLVRYKTNYKQDFNTPLKKFGYFVLLLVAACFILFLLAGLFSIFN